MPADVLASQHRGVCADLAADDVFEAADKALGDGRRADDEAENQTLVIGDVVSFDVKCGGDKHKCDDVSRNLRSPPVCASARAIPDPSETAS